MPSRILVATATIVCVLVALSGLVLSGPVLAETSVAASGQRDPARTQTTAGPPADGPEAQEAVGTGGLRYWLIAALLALLSVLVAGLGVVYWMVTVPPGKRRRH